jgi:hypothetical protein
MELIKPVEVMIVDVFYQKTVKIYKTDLHEITEILLKVALKTITLTLTLYME